MPENRPGSAENDARCWRSECRTGCYYLDVCSERPSAENDAHRCATPPEAMPGDEWTCPACGLTYWADDTEETWGEGTFEWRVFPPGRTDG